jgi:hypothetical protein
LEWNGRDGLEVIKPSFWASLLDRFHRRLIHSGLGGLLLQLLRLGLDRFLLRLGLNGFLRDL